jgi:prepilin-type N-terminal cleavage/methylation domain-containing protein
MWPSLRNQSGFTLPELLVATAVIGLVMAGVFLIQQQGQHAYLLGSNRVETQQNARVALDLMSRELRTATSVAAIANCDGTSGPDITFVDQDGRTIRYQLSGATLNRTEDGVTTALIGGVAALTMTCVPNSAATVETITIGIVTSTEESVAAGMPGHQRATMGSTVTLRATLS